ncbi:MAG TPA: iron-sulfur cluster assembly accessory protein [Candidatus Acidoferrales bacterium]|jgi:iron-sulfur cluster insertion protein|nr:iron-sulfur cluster assembly accessory protein [Candidatus Acidoferrales bacterium]
MSEVGTAEPVVSLTEDAMGEVKSLLSKSENTGKNLRLYIEQGGCSGMQYGMVFDEKRDGDLVSDWGGVNVLIDPVSVDYLRGAVVDYNSSLTAGGFKISNPNAKQSCGCGKSFQT